MKVALYETVEVSDEERVAIAAHLDGEGAKKRQATRDEMKAFLWEEGSRWQQVLGTGTPDPDPADAEEDLEDLEDLIGDVDLEDLL
jgi:hypothetical protein